MISRLDHVQLAAPPHSEARIRAFYGEVLGMTEVRKPAALAARGGCWFTSGEVHLHIGVEADFQPARKAHPGFVVTELSALADRLTSQGATVIWNDEMPGRRRFHSQDPFGNRLEFLEPAPTPSR